MKDNQPTLAYRGYAVHIEIIGRSWWYFFVDHEVRFQDAGGFTERSEAVAAAKNAVDEDIKKDI